MAEQDNIFFYGALGLNNKIDQSRQRTSEGNLLELEEATNVDIDETGRVSRRMGQVSLSTVKSHSLFCKKGDCFVVQDRTSDSAIYKVEVGFTLTGVRSGLTKGLRVSFEQVGAKTYYTNGVESGVITAGVSTAWPTETHVGPKYTAEYYPLPNGTKICCFQNRMWVAEDNVIWVSEVNSFGKYRKAKMFFQFGTNVLMMKPVASGVFVSDEKKTGFIKGAEKFEDYSWIPLSDTPAHEYSENIELVKLSNTALKIPGLSAVWSSNEGQCVGTEDGQLVIVTENALFYPTGGSGATVVADSIIINNVY